MARRISVLERVLQFCRWRGPDECWSWYGTTNGTGYPVVFLDRRNNYAHRVIYELVHGPVPEGLEVHHVCENTLCVNPQHLKAVTHTENVRARFENRNSCHRGHPYDPIDTYPGRRYCRVCRRLRAQRDRARGRG